LVGTGSLVVTSDLSERYHLIDAEAYDAAGNRAYDTVGIWVRNSPPTIEIVEPAAGAGPFCADQRIGFRATVFDPNTPDLTLPDAAVTWTVQGQALPFATGKTASGTFPPGTHIVVARATDSQGLWEERTRAVTTESCDGNQAPVCRITRPATDSTVNDPAHVIDGFDPARGLWYADVTLKGDGIDNEDGALPDSALVWTTDRTSLQPAVLGYGRALTARLYSNSCAGTLHTVTLTVRDREGRTDTATRLIQIWSLC
jgi:hypothetical protein